MGLGSCIHWLVFDFFFLFSTFDVLLHIEFLFRLIIAPLMCL